MRLPSLVLASTILLAAVATPALAQQRITHRKATAYVVKALNTNKKTKAYGPWSPWTFSLVGSKSLGNGKHEVQFNDTKSGTLHFRARNENWKGEHVGPGRHRSNDATVYGSVRMTQAKGKRVQLDTVVEGVRVVK